MNLFFFASLKKLKTREFIFFENFEKLQNKHLFFFGKLKKAHRKLNLIFCELTIKKIKNITLISCKFNKFQ